MKPRVVLYLLAVTGFLAAIGWGGRFAWIEGQLRREPLRGELWYDIRPYVNCENHRYGIGPYTVWDIGAVRLAFQGRPKEEGFYNTGVFKVFTPPPEFPEVVGSERKLSSMTVNGNFTFESWVEGWKYTFRLWDTTEITVYRGVLTVDGREFTVLERPRLVVLDKAGRVVKVEDLPATSAPKGMAEAAAIARGQP
jgi:hypothetical protein